MIWISKLDFFINNENPFLYKILLYQKQALFHLNKYYTLTSNEKALDKMRDIAEKNDLLGYEYEKDIEDEVKNYGVSHSNKLYIIDKEGNVRVVWRGIEWTYASVYHDVQLLL